MTKKKLHWTQTPKGREHMRQAAKKAVKARKKRNAEFKSDKLIAELKKAEIRPRRTANPFTLKEPSGKTWTHPDGSTLKVTETLEKVEDMTQLQIQIAYLHGKCQQIIETAAVLTGSNLIDLTIGVANRLNASIGS